MSIKQDQYFLDLDHLACVEQQAESEGDAHWLSLLADIRKAITLGATPTAALATAWRLYDIRNRQTQQPAETSTEDSLD